MMRKEGLCLAEVDNNSELESNPELESNSELKSNPELKRLYDAAFEELRTANLMDDEYARIFFEDNIRDTQVLLRIIMNKPDLLVKSVNVQHQYSGNEELRSAIFDVYAVDSEGTQYDIEVQKESGGATPYRAAFNSAVMTANSLKKGEPHIALAERHSVVIFITLHDVMKGNMPVYTVGRVCFETGKHFDDGTAIIYVNTAHKDYSTAIGKLIHDFRCYRPKEMYIPEFAETAARVYRVKGGKYMKSLDAIREYGEREGMAKERKNIALGFIQLGQVALEDIARICSMTLQQVQDLAATLKS